MIVLGKLGTGLHAEGPAIKVKAHIVYLENKTVIAAASSCGLQTIVYSFTVSDSEGNGRNAHRLLQQG